MSVPYEDRVEVAKLIVMNYMETMVKSTDGESDKDRINNEIEFLVNEVDRYGYADQRHVEKFNYSLTGEGSLDSVSTSIKNTSILRDATRILIADRVIALHKM